MSINTLDITNKSFAIIKEAFDKSLYNKWIKLISLEKTFLYSNYNRKNHFIHVANVVADDDKKRNTVIKFIHVIDVKEFKKKEEYIYIFTINDRIVKIGGTRTGLANRVTSYLCGHHIIEREKSGDCSKTNAYIYNTFDFYITNGAEIKMYAYKLPVIETIVKIFDIENKIIVQTYHAYESTFLEDYKKINKSYPILSDNCDPNYKK